jgi:hypothetical protein
MMATVTEICTPRKEEDVNEKENKEALARSLEPTRLFMCGVYSLGLAGVSAITDQPES